MGVGGFRLEPSPAPPMVSISRKPDGRGEAKTQPGTPTGMQHPKQHLSHCPNDHSSSACRCCGGLSILGRTSQEHSTTGLWALTCRRVCTACVTGKTASVADKHAENPTKYPILRHPRMMVMIANKVMLPKLRGRGYAHTCVLICTDVTSR